jgi:hypothetical protein
MTADRIVALLARLRRDIEGDCDESPIHTLDLNAGTLLDDVARALGLDESQVQAVLGPASYAAIGTGGAHGG